MLGPTTSSFGAGTTNFTSVGNLFQAANMVLAKTTTAVRWTGLVNASGKDFDTHVKMGDLFVSLNVSALGQTINSTAVVNMSGIDCAHFQLFYASGFYSDVANLTANGQLVATQANLGGACTDSSICTSLSCTGGVLSFTAQHFDGFGGGNGPYPVPEFGTIALVLALGLVIAGLVQIKRRN